MNYRHAFHAGNYADVVKHLVLARVLTYLHEKPSPFRVIDTHAGAGLYDLTSREAERGGEWQAGIARVLAEKWPDAIGALLKPYLDIVRAYHASDRITVYPGSPLITRALMRPEDHLTACEIEPDVRAALIDALRRDPQARVVDLDGYLALKAFVPPPERRGVVLVDPPFEAREEFDRLSAGFAAAYAKWPTGIYVLWYPVKDFARADGLMREVTTIADKALRIELAVCGANEMPKHARGGLTRAGLIVVNPPWTLEADLGKIMPALTQCLALTGKAAFRLDHGR